jgi:hypothetical protein
MLASLTTVPPMPLEHKVPTSVVSVSLLEIKDVTTRPSMALEHRIPMSKGMFE